MTQPNGDVEAKKYSAPALSKGLDILEALASDGGGYTQVEIAKILRRSTSEIFRMLVVLRQRGYLELGSDDRYRLTTKLFEIAHRHPPIRRLTAIAGEAMQKLANQIDQSVHMCILHTGRLLVVAQVDCPGNTISTVRLGAQFEIYNSASGRVLAAFMDVDELQNLMALAGETSDAEREAFLSDIAEVRRVGYCQGASLLIEGVINLSAPVFDNTGKAIAAVTTPFIRRLSGTETMPVTESREILVETCRELSRRMGVGASDQSVF